MDEDPLFSGMSAVQWRRTPSLVEYATGLQRDAMFRRMMSVLWRSAPKGWPPRGDSPTETQVALEMGRIVGYQDALLVLESLSQPLNKPLQMPPVTYGAQEDPE